MLALPEGDQLLSEELFSLTVGLVCLGLLAEESKQTSLIAENLELLLFSEVSILDVLRCLQLSINYLLDLINELK